MLRGQRVRHLPSTCHACVSYPRRRRFCPLDAVLREDFGMNASMPEDGPYNSRSSQITSKAASSDEDKAKQAQRWLEKSELSADNVRFINQCMYPHDHALHERLRALIDIKRSLAAMPHTRDALLGVTPIRREAANDPWVSPPPPPASARELELQELYIGDAQHDGPLMGLSVTLSEDVSAIDAASTSRARSRAPAPAPTHHPSTQRKSLNVLSRMGGWLFG